MHGPPYQNKRVKCIKYIGLQKKTIILQYSSIQGPQVKFHSPYSVQKEPDHWVNISRASNLWIQKILLTILLKEIQDGVWEENNRTSISIYLKHKKLSITNI